MGVLRFHHRPDPAMRRFRETDRIARASFGIHESVQCHSVACFFPVKQLLP